jgi:MFS superfamily sulfate permease-like transporter/mannitol/fructose-specific phosphotransferase system IIA component (Ntr-type)
MNEETDTNPTSPAKGVWLADFLASTVVFLVALPLCIGIAVACGVPAEAGLVTGIIGGLIVGVFTGAPLLVSGPAASLIVLVVDLIDTHGIEALGPVVVLAGVWQMLAGTFRVGGWFRAVAPAVILGMLIGIGVLILVSQLHVCLDADPAGSFGDNLFALPASLAGDDILAPFVISATTIALIASWPKIRPQRLRLVPGQLIALLIVTPGALLLAPEVRFLDMSPNFFGGLTPPTVSDYGRLASVDLVVLSLVFAFVASAATLLTANAIDQRQNYHKTNYDKEMFAQGIGNALTGAVGGLPMTGVIVRSSVNVDAGARTRRSTILHGIWILIFVGVAPQLLEMLPKASLGAILVYTGYRLVDFRGMRALYIQGRAELAICLITLFGVVVIDLFTGIVAGLAAAIFKIVYTFARLEIHGERTPQGSVYELHLLGSATFLQVPRLATALDEVPEDCELRVHIDRLDHIDHACLQLLSTWSESRESSGRSGMVVEWDELTDRYRNAVIGGGREAPAPGSMVSTIWAEWKRVYAPPRRGESTGDGTDLIPEAHIRLHVDTTSLAGVIAAASDALAEASGLEAADLEKILLDRVEGHVALGAGVSVPHAPVPGLANRVAALVTTSAPIPVDEDRADVFFVLLAPPSDPRQHLQGLAHVGRLCHDENLLDGLRMATSAGEAIRVLRLADANIYDSGVIISPRLLGVVELDRSHRSDRIRELIREAFGDVYMDVVNEDRILRMVRKVVRAKSDQLLLVPIVEREVATLRALLDEEQKVEGGPSHQLHLMGVHTLANDGAEGVPLAVDSVA